MKSQDDQLITTRLTAYVTQVVGDNHCVPIHDEETADILEQLAKGKTYIFLQRKDYNGLTLPKPLLWYYTYWRNSVERYEDSKKRSEKERLERFLMEENVYRLAKAITRETGIDGDAAKALAYRKLKQNNCAGLIRDFFRVTLVTKQEDLG